MLYDVRRLLYACCMLVAPAAPGLRTEASGASDKQSDRTRPWPCASPVLRRWSSLHAAPWRGLTSRTLAGTVDATGTFGTGLP